MTVDILATVVISLKVSVVGTACALAVALPLAWWMANSEFRYKPLVETLLLAPLVLPPTVVGYILLVTFSPVSWSGAVLQHLVPSGLLFTWPAAACAVAIVAFPLGYRSARGAFEQIDRQLLTIGRTLGATPWQSIYKIAIPLAAPGLSAAAILTFVRALGEFGATLIVAGNIPGQTQTIPLAIYSAIELGQIETAGYWVLLISAIALVLTVILARLDAVARKRPQKSALAMNDVFEQKPLLPQDASDEPHSLDLDVYLAVDDFELKVSHQSTAKRIAILGASGSGKSLLLQIIAGAIKPSSGHCTINGTNFFRNHYWLPSEKRQVGYLPQGFGLFPHLSVRDNIAFGAKVTASLVDECLSISGLADVAHLLPRQISGGQKQRTALARAFMQRPKLLLLDEPLSALDTHVRQIMERLIARSTANFSGHTLLVTHNLDEAYRIGEEMIVLDNGRMIAAGPREKVFRDPGNLMTATITGCKNVFSARTPSADVLEIPELQGIKVPLQRCATNIKYAGIRANDIRITTVPSRDRELHVPVVFDSVSEAAHRCTVSVSCGGSKLIQIELTYENWYALKTDHQQWYLAIDPKRVMPLTD